MNEILIYFAEAPADRLTLPGLFRVVRLPIEYHPETGREPADLPLQVRDSSFNTIGY